MSEDQTVGTYAAVFDASDRDAIAEGRQKSHDMLIQVVGDHRRGPVSWRQVPAAYGIALLTELELASYRTEGDVAGYLEMKGYLRAHPRGALIIATAPVDDSAKRVEAR